MDDKLNDYIKFKIAISKICNKEKEQAMKRKISFINRKTGIAACACMVLTTGVVFAKDIENFIKDKFYLGKGVQTAVENGYIENGNMEYVKSGAIAESLGKIYNNIEVGTKVNDFYMDDYNLGVEFSFQFDNEIKNIVNIDNLSNIELLDLIVTDEENRIIFNSASKEDFQKFCTENKLEYNHQEFNENYMNSGENHFITSHNSETGSIIATYNMYTDGYPKSKKLNLNFGKLKIVENSKEDNIVTLTGDWNIELDVPEKMYNRTEEYYKVVSCDNKDFEIYTSKVTDTGFELGIRVSNMERPIYPEELKAKEEEIAKSTNSENIETIVDGKKTTIIDTTIISDSEDIDNEKNQKVKELYTQSPYKEMYEEYWKKMQPINVTGDSHLVTLKQKTEGSYILNSNNERFNCSMSPARKQNANYIDGNKFDFYETFEMTKYNATDKIKVIIEFNEKPVVIELEKISK